jgi:hypothetical protein
VTARDLFVGADGRPRWAWRLVLFALALVVSLLVVRGIVMPVASQVMLLSGEQLLLEAWLILVALLLAHVLMVSVVDRRGWRWLAMDRQALRPSALLPGAAIGTLAIGLPAGLLLAARWLRVEPTADGSWAAAAGSLATTLARPRCGRSSPSGAIRSPCSASGSGPSPPWW